VADFGVCLRHYSLLFLVAPALRYRSLLWPLAIISQPRTETGVYQHPTVFCRLALGDFETAPGAVGPGLPFTDQALILRGMSGRL
jgi:hypothetical protein